MAHTEQSDESLHAAYCAGDMAAFDSLYARYRQPLYLFLLRRGHTESNAEDIFHDCWMKVIDHRDRFDGHHFRAWVYSVARNLSIDVFRKESLREVSEFDENHSPDVHLSAQKVQEGMDCIKLIKSSVAELPVAQRDVFLLQQEGGLSLQQIADLMSVGRETIKSRLRYAMNQLKQLMAECL
jgi:RNA polymerase sigma-70 factor (ECF subfamily)